MDLTLLDINLTPVHVSDSYKSLIWTDRYSDYGDFELYTAVTDDILQYATRGCYILCPKSEHVMIVESLKIESSFDEGNYITITGRSLESILSRRIVWGQRRVTGKFQNCIKTILNEAIINPTDNNRKIPNFIFEDSTDPAVDGLSLDIQFTGDNVYDIISTLCYVFGLGFKITLNDNKQFVFKLYSGHDRSYSQFDRPYVIFSPRFENVINSDYFESDASLKNVTLVGGEGEGSDRVYVSVGSGSGLSRRELFTDARDISSGAMSDEPLTTEEYKALLRQRGAENLSDFKTVKTFSGKTETTIMFKYEEDFFNGDIVQIENEYGHEARARITEIIMNEDSSGFSVYPTFETINEE